MMMQKDQEHRFWCRFCNKGFVSGNCLGGHMRGHLALISAEKCGENCDGDLGSDQEDELSTEIKVSVSSEIELEASYGLRENPKKSWRCSDSDLMHVCKKCRREFSSVKSLAAHMRSHLSGRRGEETAICKECGKIFGSMKALFGHMRCHPKQSRVSDELYCELVSPIRKKRSRTWYSKMIPIFSEACSDMNASSSIAGTEIDEVKEAATCLMMISMGYEVRMVVEDNGLELEKLNLSKKSKLVDQDFELEVQSCDGYIESAPDDEVLQDSEKNVEFKCRTCEKVFHTIQALRGHQRIHRTSDGCTKLKVESCRELTQTSFLPVPVVDSELQGAKNLLDGNESGVGIRSCDVKKSNLYECSTCFKVFKSGQALGGHKRAHYFGPNASKAKETVLMDLQLPPHCNDIPAILNEVPASEVNQKPWWTGNSSEFEPQAIFN